MVLFAALLVIAVSIDSFGVGIVFGLKNIQISAWNLFIIATLSGFVFYSSMFAASFLKGMFPAHLSESIGAYILIAVGVYLLVQIVIPLKGNEESYKEKSQEVPHLAHILKDPQKADMDDSGAIRGKEVIVLALALSLDTVGAGISAAFIGIHHFATSVCIGAATSGMLFIGAHLGRRLRHVKWIDNMSLLPAILLITIGILKLV